MKPKVRQAVPLQNMVPLNPGAKGQLKGNFCRPTGGQYMRDLSFLYFLVVWSCEDLDFLEVEQSRDAMLGNKFHAMAGPNVVGAL